MAGSYGNGSLFEEVKAGKPTGFWIAEKRIRSNGIDSVKRFRKNNKREAKEALALWLRENAVGVKSDKTTVREFLDNYVGAAAWAGKTRETNTQNYNKHVIVDNQFCRLPYKEVDSDDAKSFLSRVVGTENTRHTVYALCRAGFQTAVVEDSIKRNPFTLARTNRPKASKSEVVSFTIEHEAKLFDYLRSRPKWRPLVLLAFDSGCRMAEITGLQFSSFERISGHLTGWLKVNHTLDTINNKPVLKLFAKSESSYKRAIRLSRTTMEALAPLLGAQDGPGYVFLNKIKGEPKTWTHSAFYKQWLGVLKAAGVPDYHFHSTRHTCATRLLKAGCYIVAVSKRLGHSKPSITLDVYGDCIPADQDKLADVFDADMVTYSAKFHDVPEIDTKIDTTVQV